MKNMKTFRPPLLALAFSVAVLALPALSRAKDKEPSPPAKAIRATPTAECNPDRST